MFCIPNRIGHSPHTHAHTYIASAYPFTYVFYLLQLPCPHVLSLHLFLSLMHMQKKKKLLGHGRSICRQSCWRVSLLHTDNLISICMCIYHCNANWAKPRIRPKRNPVLQQQLQQLQQVLDESPASCLVLVLVALVPVFNKYNTNQRQRQTGKRTLKEM